MALEAARSHQNRRWLPGRGDTAIDQSDQAQPTDRSDLEDGVLPVKIPLPGGDNKRAQQGTLRAAAVEPGDGAAGEVLVKGAVVRQDRDLVAAAAAPAARVLFPFLA